MDSSFLEWLSQFSKGRNKINLKYLQLPFFIRYVISVIWMVLKFLLKISLLNPFVSIAFIPTQSMSRTILTNDVVISTPLAYGIDLLLLGEIIPWKNAAPKKGDVVSFRAEFFSYVLAKRVIGEAGDTVQFIDGTLFINDKPCVLEYVCDTSFIENDTLQEGAVFKEHVPNSEKSYEVFFLGGNPVRSAGANTEKFVIPKDYYFLAGDNRGGSRDSRSWLGLVHRTQIKSKVLFILFSNANMRTLNLKSFFSGIRFERLFSWII